MPCDNQLNLGDFGITVKTDASGHAVAAQFDLPNGSRVVRPLPPSGELIMQLGLGLGLTCVQQAGGGGGETVLAEIDHAGDTEITEYVNEDVIEVTGDVDFSDCTALVTFNVPNLTTVGGNFLTQSMDSMTTLITALRHVGGHLNLKGLYTVSPLDLSDLEDVGGNLALDSIELVTDFPMDSLTDIGGGLDIDSMEGGAISVSLSAIVNIGTNVDRSIRIGDLTPLATWSFGTTLERVESHVLFTGGDCALNQASVDNILVRLAALDGTSGTTSYDNLTVDLTGGPNAVPSATGLAAKATLEGRGCTVTVNE